MVARQAHNLETLFESVARNIVFFFWHNSKDTYKTKMMFSSFG